MKISKITERLENYPYLTSQAPVKTKVQNGVRVIEINGKLLEKITIDQAMDKLSSKERDAIYLVYLFGVEPDEAAQFLKVSRWAVYKRLKRGIKQLDKILNMVENTHSDTKC